MAQFDDGNDKDFVLSSEYQDHEVLEPREGSQYRSGSGTADGRAFKHIYIAIAGFLTLIILCVVLIARTYSLAEKAQLLAVESRLEQLEGRLGSMEGEGTLSQTGGSGNQLILLTERLDQLEANMRAQINDMVKELNALPPKPAVDSVQKAAAQKETPAAKKETKAKMHTVKQGDTLYRISQRYQLSVDQLREYNKLGAKSAIYPGQQLYVTPPK